jgi:hypothetical protein
MKQQGETNLGSVVFMKELRYNESIDTQPIKDAVRPNLLRLNKLQVCHFIAVTVSLAILLTRISMTK